MELNEATELVVQSVAFRPDGVLEVQYSEGHDQSDSVAIVKVLMFDRKVAEQQVAELLADITDLIGTAIDKLRQPPATRRSGLR